MSFIYDKLIPPKHMLTAVMKAWDRDIGTRDAVWDNVGGTSTQILTLAFLLWSSLIYTNLLSLSIIVIIYECIYLSGQLE